jgi:hypothetical protein
MTTAEIKDRIAALEEKNGKLKQTLGKTTNENLLKTGPALVEKYEKEIQDLKEKLKSTEEEESNKAKEKADKEEKEKAEKEEKKKASRQKSEGAKAFTFEGKTIDPSEVDYCKKLLAAVNQQRSTRKKAAKKYRTDPVFKTMTSNVARTVVKAMKTVDAASLKKNPEKKIEQFKALKTSFSEFMRSFKAILGEDYDASEIKESLHAIDEHISKVEAKYAE